MSKEKLTLEEISERCDVSLELLQEVVEKTTLKIVEKVLKDYFAERWRNGDA